MQDDKRKVIYEAALSLMDEKHDMSAIKVADIAKKADIGKGTVYEYFQSKEQLLAEAVIYMLKQGVCSVGGAANEEIGFTESFFAVLGNICMMMSKNMTMLKYMTTNGCNFSMHKEAQTVMENKLANIRSMYINIFEKLVEKGIGEGFIKGKPSLFDRYLAYNNCLMCIIIYKQGFDELMDLTESEMMEKAFRMFVKLLN